jgi:hypothetical protein
MYKVLGCIITEPISSRQTQYLQFTLQQATKVQRESTCMYRSTPFVTLALDGVGGRRHSSTALSWERPGTLVQEAGWAPGPVCKGAENPSHRDSISAPSSFYRVAILTALSRSTDVLYTENRHHIGCFTKSVYVKGGGKGKDKVHTRTNHEGPDGE